MSSGLPRRRITGYNQVRSSRDFERYCAPVDPVKGPGALCFLSYCRSMLRRLLLLAAITLGSLGLPAPTQATHEPGWPPTVRLFDQADAGFQQVRIPRPRQSIRLCTVPGHEAWVNQVAWAWSQAAGWYMFSVGTTNCQITWTTDDTSWAEITPNLFTWFTHCTIHLPASAYGAHPQKAIHELGHCLGFVDNPWVSSLVQFREWEGPNVHQCNYPYSPSTYSAYAGVMSYCVSSNGFPPLNSHDKSSLMYGGMRDWDCVGFDPVDCNNGD